MPTFSRVSHISFSVRDADASARWWAELLELAELDRVVGDGWRAILLMHPPSRTIIECQQHDGNQGETFDPRRTGSITWGSKSTRGPTSMSGWHGSNVSAWPTRRSPRPNTVRC